MKKLYNRLRVNVGGSPFFSFAQRHFMWLGCLNGIFLCALFFHSQYTEDYVREETLNFKYTRIYITKAQAKVERWQFIMERHKKTMRSQGKRYALSLVGGRRFCLLAPSRFYINHISTLPN